MSMNDHFTICHAESDADIASCFSVMHELRPHLVSPQELVERVNRQANESYRLLAAWRDRTPIALAGYRIQELLVSGRFVYVDDLVVASCERRKGLGAKLLNAVVREGRQFQCNRLVLDTAMDNFLGQRFYFRYGMFPRALRFGKSLD